MMNYLSFVFFVLLTRMATAFPGATGWYRRDLQHVLESTAKKAETIGKEAIRYFVPSTVTSGMAVVKPFLRKRRSLYSGQQPQWPENYWLINNNARSAIIYPNPNNYYPNGYFSGWQFNPYSNGWAAPSSRSMVAAYPYPVYYPMQQYYNSFHPSRILPNSDTGANPGKDDSETKASLEDFNKLVSQVDSAFLSYSDKAGVTLNESLKGEEAKNKPKKNKEKGGKRSKSPNELKNEQMNIISKTFTDFVCGDNC